MEPATAFLLLRITARMSVCFFVLAFVAPALPYLWGAASRWLAQRKAAWLAGLVVVHGVHVATIAFLIATLEGFAREKGAVVIGGGALAYALFVLTLLVNLPVGRVWQWAGRWNVESVAMWWGWVIFALAFTARMFESSLYLYLPFAVLVWAAALVRVMGMRRRRQQALTATA